MQQKLTLIKLGGSIITNKEVPMLLRKDVLKRLIAEVAQAQKKTGELYIIGHGQGSFAHVPASKYKTMDGFINDDSVLGMAVTQDSAAQLNRIVVKEFLAAGLPAVSFNFSSTLVTANNEAQHWCGAVLEQYLEKGLLPITGGDVLVDTQKGCTIWSTELVLGFLAEYFRDSKKYMINQLIHVTDVPGVLDAKGEVIPHLSTANSSAVAKLVGKTNGFDVTGGMAHKIEESLKLAVAGVTTKIISGLEQDTLYHSLLEDISVGTIITR